MNGKARTHRAWGHSCMATATGTIRGYLCECEDLPWFPQSIRTAMQDHLRALSNCLGSAYRPFVRKLSVAMGQAGQDEIVDLCSGGGGPVRTLLPLLQQHGVCATAWLTDLYPNFPAYQQLEHDSSGMIHGYPYPVNAAHVPSALSGFRLLTNGFHHLHPHEAVTVLTDAVTQRRGIAILELVGRSASAVVSVCLAFLAAFISAPFVKPFRFSRLLFTYVVPLVPVCTLWDGLVSCLRVYSPQELQTLVSQLGPTDYDWDIGTLRIGPCVATYLIGVPVCQPR